MKDSQTEQEKEAFRRIWEMKDKDLWECREVYEFDKYGVEYAMFHVNFLRRDGSNESFNVPRESLASLGKKGRQYSIQFPQPLTTPCEVVHSHGVCRCV